MLNNGMKTFTNFVAQKEAALTPSPDRITPGIQTQALLQKKVDQYKEQRKALYQAMQAEIEQVKAKHLPGINALETKMHDMMKSIGADPVSIDYANARFPKAQMQPIRDRQSFYRRKGGVEDAARDLKNFDGDQQLFNLYRRIKNRSGDLRDMDPDEAEKMIARLNHYLDPVKDFDGDYMSDRIEYDRDARSARYNEDPEE